ncbi:hypothetical protein ACFYQA_08220 [Streptomyces sp. NPDC005774]|uniref:hypothetical protein n=1 Tax=Streptomyces sp. NPDC005774 TaxID=3364728 RepID=UPI0036B0234F
MPYEPWQPGMRITATRLGSISPTWQDWTPVWATTSGAATPSFNNANVTARYAVAARTVYYRLEIAFGTTTNFGGGTTTDNWQFSAPVAASSAMLITGMGDIELSGPSTRMPVRARLNSATQFVIECSGRRYDDAVPNSSGVIDAVTPWTWASGSAIRLHGSYEAAA